MYSFKNDYTATAHPRLLQALIHSNLEQDEGYGLDKHSMAAKEHIRRCCGAYGTHADIHFLCGGTQTNMVALASFLRPHEAVLAPETAHICVHETGAIEATGHKIIATPSVQGKLLPAHVLAVLETHTDEHMVKPRLVKLTNATELGTLYTLAELEALSALCRSRNLLLYIDGARLGYALTAAENDVTLEDMCRLADAFYIGGTKNGALMGEALVLCNAALQEDFRYLTKQRGAMLAKGRVLGVQFEEFFQDGLYWELARTGNVMAQTLAAGLRKAGYRFFTESPTNQIFPILPNTLIRRLENDWAFYVWHPVNETHSAIRLVTDWATDADAVHGFVAACSTAL